jgi:hypothetical protein
MRTFLDIAAKRKMNMHLANIETVFLNADLHEGTSAERGGGWKTSGHAIAQEHLWIE